MTCNILYLYPDLMNLYGDNGNIRGLQRHLEDQGVQVQVRRVDPEETPCFAHVNLIYMGSGTERSQKAALKALLPHTEPGGGGRNPPALHRQQHGAAGPEHHCRRRHRL